MNKDPRPRSKAMASEHWLLTAGRRSARLLSASLTPYGRLHVEPRAEIREDWHELQHGRPSPRIGKDNHTYASLGHEDDERTHRFVSSVASWLNSELGARQVETVHAFTGPGFLGELRGVLPVPLQARVHEYPVNLEHLAPGDLAVHEAVIQAVSTDMQVDKEARLKGEEVLLARTQDRSTANQLALEHAAIRRAVRDLRNELELLLSEKGPSHRVGRLSGMLRMFRHHLSRHFELEEKGGYLEKLEGISQDREQLIDLLLAEHQSFERSLLGLLDAAERAEETQARLSDSFVQGLRDLLDGILRHEHAENALVGELVAQRPPKSH